MVYIDLLMTLWVGGVTGTFVAPYLPAAFTVSAWRFFDKGARTRALRQTQAEEAQRRAGSQVRALRR